jgi:hypothetical protein
MKTAGKMLLLRPRYRATGQAGVPSRPAGQ